MKSRWAMPRPMTTQTDFGSEKSTKTHFRLKWLYPTRWRSVSSRSRRRRRRTRLCCLQAGARKGQGWCSQADGSETTVRTNVMAIVGSGVGSGFVQLAPLDGDLHHSCAVADGSNIRQRAVDIGTPRLHPIAVQRQHAPSRLHACTHQSSMRIARPSLTCWASR
jgi:hypothetical protein